MWVSRHALRTGYPLRRGLICGSRGVMFSGASLWNNITVGTKGRMAACLCPAALPLRARRLFSQCSSTPNPQGPEEPSFWTDSTAWRRASVNTSRCLVGCSSGDFAMLGFLQANHPELGVGAVMALSMTAGLTTSVLLETVLLQRSDKLGFRPALKTALGMSFISMLGMEAAENWVNFQLTGGVVDVEDAWWWFAFAPSMLAGFLAPLPYNYHQLKKYGRSCH